MNDDRHLWQYRWFRDLAALAAVALVVIVVLWVRAIILPVVLGLALAYVVNPWITWLHRRVKIARWLSTAALLALGGILLLALGLYVVPRLVGETTTLVNNLPRYLHTVGDQVQRWQPEAFHLTPATAPADEAATQPAVTQSAAAEPAPAPAPGATEPAASQPARTTQDWLSPLLPKDVSEMGAMVVKWLGLGLGVVSSAMSLAAYVGLAVLVTLVCFFYFSWRFPDITAWFKQFIPPAKSARWLHILHRMDQAVAAWFRGRLIQATGVGTILSVGWGLAGVPYFLLLGILGGCCNLVPYLASLTLPAAIVLVWVDGFSHGVAFNVWHVLVWPAGVYFIAQGFDGWVVEPLVQGRATSLDPLAVMLAVLIGASLAGVLGMILAIPVAACTKILWQEILREKVRQLIDGVTS